MKKAEYYPVVGRQSCCGFDNYFTLHEGPYVINMWAESLQSKKIKGKITGWLIGENLFFVDDLRLKNLTNNKLCFTGSNCSISGSKFRECYSLLYPNNQLDCYCNNENNYASYSYERGAVGQHRENVNQGHCRCCGRRMYFDGTGKELTKEQFDEVWNKKD